MIICAATNNAKKLVELKRILEGDGHEVKSLKELEIFIDPEETGETFMENAIIKAEEICKYANLPTIADDSGLCVEALLGAPGVYSARYAGEHGNDEANNDKLIFELEKINAQNRNAKFVSAVCLVMPNGTKLSCEGECQGTVATERKIGAYGFGYDPLFIPTEIGVVGGGKTANDEKLSYAQLTPQQKDAISHRGRAMEKLQAELANFLKNNV